MFGKHNEEPKTALVFFHIEKWKAWNGCICEHQCTCSSLEPLAYASGIFVVDGRIFWIKYKQRGRRINIRWKIVSLQLEDCLQTTPAAGPWKSCRFWHTSGHRSHQNEEKQPAKMKTKFTTRTQRGGNWIEECNLRNTILPNIYLFIHQNMKGIEWHNKEKVHSSVTRHWIT